jgi:hypothetical protein
VLVNNAGITRDMTFKKWLRLFFLERGAMMQAALDFGGATKPAFMRSGAPAADGAT